jgi:hypothetical protein
MAAALLGCVVLLTASRGATEESVPGNAQALLLLRSLGYDKSVKDRAHGGQVSILVVHKPGSSSSQDCQRELSTAIGDAIKQMTVVGLPAAVNVLPYPKGEIGDELKRLGPQAVYVCPGLDAELSKISAAARQVSALSFTGTETYVRNGIAIGFVVRNGRPGLIVNVPESQAEGAQLESALLRVAELIR